MSNKVDCEINDGVSKGWKNESVIQSTMQSAIRLLLQYPAFRRFNLPDNLSKTNHINHRIATNFVRYFELLNFKLTD